VSGAWRWAAARRRGLTALLLFALSTGWVIAAQRDQGIARDETVYMTYGTGYANWWIDLLKRREGVVGEKRITGAFGGPGATDNNREHPPLMKTLFGFSEKLFHDTLGWTSETTGYRLPTAAVNGLLVALVFLFASGIWGYGEGLLAGLLVLLLPRAFFHAGLACFDAPIAAFWFACLVAYDRALRRGGWLLLGLCFGFALATKHNALLLPFALLAHYAWVAARGQRAAIAEAWRGGRRASVVRYFGRGLLGTRPSLLLSLAVVGPLTLVALWPWLWFDTVEHVRAWIAFHMHHVHYNFEYLGDNWNAPPFPWHVALVTTLLTVPVATLAAAAAGAVELGVRAWRGAAAAPERAPALLLFLSAGVSMGPFFLGSTPIFGAEKHWAPAIPTLCIFAGVGIVALGRLAATALVEGNRLAPVREGRTAPLIAAGLGALVVAAAAAETVEAQPYALSSYNALAGGAAGGADLGMNRQFWGYAARGVLPFLNAHAPAPGQPAAPVYSHDASPAWGIYQRQGLLARSLPDSGGEYAGGIGRSRWAIVVHERHFNRHDYLIWSVYGTVQPVFVLRKDGVPIVSVYEHPPLPK
jgi:dolichyl-phosphate-mannose-protein mannosyltransferase